MGKTYRVGDGEHLEKKRERGGSLIGLNIFAWIDALNCFLFLIVGPLLLKNTFSGGGLTTLASSLELAVVDGGHVVRPFVPAKRKKK